jgi:hypothetical protein
MNTLFILMIVSMWCAIIGRVKVKNMQTVQNTGLGAWGGGGVDGKSVRKGTE